MEIVEKILNRYSLKLLSVAFIVLGVLLLTDFYMLEDELLKTITMFLFIVGTLYLAGIFISFLNQKMDDFVEQRNLGKVALETFKTLSKEEARYVSDYMQNEKRRFKFLYVVDLLQSNILIQKVELSDDVIVELNQAVRKFIKQKLKGKS